MKKTSSHVDTCNVGQSEAHNRREESYLAKMNEKNIYIRRDLTPLNEMWISDRMAGRNLPQYLDDIGILVKEKTGRKMQTKERTYKDEKTGRTKTKSGCSAIREDVVLCQADTTMEQLHRYTQLCHERYGITPIQIYIHRDEGHYENPVDKSTWIPNLHAHIIWDWMDYETGTTRKLKPKDMSIFQDFAAEALGMERGTPKAETGREHLERNDYIIAKQKDEAEKARLEAENERLKLEILKRENEAKQQISDELDKEIADKAEKANRENGSKILQGGAAIVSALANMAGMGKYAAIEDENKELKASVPQHLKQLQDSYWQQVNQEVEKETAPLRRENEKLKNKLLQEQNRNLKRLEENEALNQKLKQAELELKKMKANLQEFLNLMDIPCRSAVQSVIDFINKGAGCLNFTQATSVNDYMAKSNDRKREADYLSFLLRPFVSEGEHSKGKKELHNVSSNFKWYEQREEYLKKKAGHWKANESKKPGAEHTKIQIKM